MEVWEALPPGLKAEVGSPYCFLCQAAQRLVVPHQMRGWPKLFKLENKVTGRCLAIRVHSSCVRKAEGLALQTSLSASTA